MLLSVCLSEPAGISKRRWRTRAFAKAAQRWQDTGVKCAVWSGS